MAEWKTIETAPKDGTPVWLWGTAEDSPMSDPHVGLEDMHVGFWAGHGWHDWQGEFWVVEPTHWQPLPEPPAT